MIVIVILVIIIIDMNESPSPHSNSLHANIPNTALIHNLHSLVVESGGIVIAISLVEDGESHLVLLRLNVVVNTKHIEEVHLISRIKGRVEVSLSELHVRLSTLLTLSILN